MKKPQLSVSILCFMLLTIFCFVPAISTANASATDTSYSDIPEVGSQSAAFRTVTTISNELPSGIITNIKYSKYFIPRDYLLITSKSARVREHPETKSKTLLTMHLYEKISLTSLVEGEVLKNNNISNWYSVLFKRGEKTIQGYISSSDAVHRTFQFQKMITAIQALKKDVETSKTGYVNNYKNKSGVPPSFHGSSSDNYGTVGYQSAPAYAEANLKSEFRYIPDGTLVSILESTDTFYKIKSLSFLGDFFVPKKYITLANSIDKLSKVVVIDRGNQNEGVFEYIDGKWNILSYVYATTGEKAKYKEPTPLGYYMAIETRNKFVYQNDLTKKPAGYAPYAIRFSGGSYIHGVPVDFKIKDGIPIYPPMQEYLSSIGTVPRSHKCVRNYTSHALFLYRWINIGKSAVIVIE